MNSRVGFCCNSPQWNVYLKHDLFRSRQKVTERMRRTFSEMSAVEKGWFWLKTEATNLGQKQLLIFDMKQIWYEAAEENSLGTKFGFYLHFSILQREKTHKYSVEYNSFFRNSAYLGLYWVYLIIHHLNASRKIIEKTKNLLNFFQDIFLHIFMRQNNRKR